MDSLYLKAVSEGRRIFFHGIIAVFAICWSLCLMRSVQKVVRELVFHPFWVLRFLGSICLIRLLTLFKLLFLEI